MPTIAAIATAPGNGGIAIVRLSGPGAKTLLARVFLPHARSLATFKPWTLHRGIFLDSEDLPLDDVLAVFMPGPKTYTGEDMAEIQCHGGSFIANAVLESLLRLGVRLAEKGEFSRRAFLNGRMDLSQAEAVAELTAAQSREALAHGLARLEGRLSAQIRELETELDELRALARIGIDFPDEEVDGLGNNDFARRVENLLAAIDLLLSGAARAALMADGGQIAIAGPVNAGKSSLLNALAGEDRALVTAIPGTTRDFIEVRLNLDGLPIRLTDTAGLRENPADQVEQLGIDRANAIIKQADLILLVLDASASDPFAGVENCWQQMQTEKCLLVWNKTDLAETPAALPDWAHNLPVCAISAKTGKNLDELCETIRTRLLGQTREISATPPNARQANALQRASQELRYLLADLACGFSYDCCLSRLDTASAALAEIVTLSSDDQLLDRIFSQFCIGK